MEPKSSLWETEYPLMPLSTICNEISGLPDTIDLMNLRETEEVFWNLIFYFKFFNLPYDLFLPYKKTDKVSLLAHKKKGRQKTGARFNQYLIKDTTWLEQFNEIRMRARCTDNQTQTESE